MKYWEIVNKIIKAGFGVGWVSALDDYGRTVWIVDAHREGKRFVVRAHEKLTAFLELERAICVSLLTEQIYRDVGFHRLVTRHWDRKSGHGCHAIVT